MNKFWIEFCGEFDNARVERISEGLDDYDPYIDFSRQVAEADSTFWTIYVSEDGGPSMALADYDTREEAEEALRIIKG